ncbi:42842_t:CDS:1 [Gigaspora margarita]|uniref:42842_t:CDS:1 n=1 Tax=Gigaspora margarita TaxID=4874 RepID=A0ABM8W1F8_GIGMA|nr:42842_t:CDS:1 [Gigaspora margarita]
MNDIEVTVEEKLEEDWKSKFYERIKVPSVRQSDPPFPPNGSIDPVEWLNYRQNLSNYIDTIKLKPIFGDLTYIDNLVSKYPYNEDKFIIKQFKASLGITTNDDESEKEKKTKTKQRYRGSSYAKNLLIVIRMLKKHELMNQREEFFLRTKFPISTLQEKDITPIIEKFIEVWWVF